jgi:hypothetical protein
VLSVVNLLPLSGGLKNLSPQRTRRPRRKTNQKARNPGKGFSEIEDKQRSRGQQMGSACPENSLDFDYWNIVLGFAAILPTSGETHGSPSRA